MPEPDPLPAIKTPWGSATPPSGASAGDVPPIPIPDHTLIRRIGKGSYGEVWLARNALGVYRAVKIIDRRAFDDARPFEREFAGMQRFEPISRSHESQLNILQVGRGPDCFYYVMELADDMGGAYASGGTSAGGTRAGGTSYTSPQSTPPLGGTSSTSPPFSPQPQMGTRGARPSEERGDSLNPDTYTPRNLRSELLLRGRLPVDECIRLGLALTTALGHLHRHGLVHRDIKPSNIVFVNGIPKLADIGLVALAESTMSFVGTEGYLPPEGPGTVQADLFSLGKVLYEISTGHDRQQFPELPTRVQELPDRAALAEFNEVLLRACAPDVKQRYESAAEMHADLALLQSGKSVARMRAVERRLKFVARAGAVVTGIAVLAGAAFLYQQFQTREARRLASENQALAEAQTQLANDKSKLADESRQRLARQRVANGVRLMNEGDLSRALLWFTEALPLVESDLEQARLHRIRLAGVLDQIPRLMFVLPHEDSVGRCWFSRDGKSLLTFARETARVWDVASGQPLSPPMLHSSRIQSGGFSPEGSHVLTGDAEGVVRVWDSARSWRCSTLQSNVSFCTWHPDGTTILICSSKRPAALIHARNGGVQREFMGDGAVSMTGAFSPDGRSLALVDGQQQVGLWDASSGQRYGSRLDIGRAVTLGLGSFSWRVPVQFDRRGRRLLVVTEAAIPRETKVEVWDVVTQRRLFGPTRGASGFISGVELSPDGSRLVLVNEHDWDAGKEGKIEVWDVDSDRLLRTLSPRISGNGAMFLPEINAVAASSWDGFAQLWNPDTGARLTPPLKHRDYVLGMALSPDGNFFATAGDDAVVKLWRLGPTSPEGQRLVNPPHGDHPAAVLSTAISPDERFLVTGSCDGVARVWETATKKLVRELRALGAGSFVQVEWSQDGARILTREEDFRDHLSPSRRAWLWDALSGQMIGSSLPETGGVVAAAFSRDGTRLASGHEDGIVRIWDARSGALVIPAWTHQGEVYCLDWSADGRRVIAGYSDGAICGWDTQSGRRLFEGQAHTGGVRSIVASPDGLRFVTVGNDQHGGIWDLATGESAGPAFKHDGSLFHAAWHPDGRRMMTGGLSRDIRTWDATTGQNVLPPMSHDIGLTSLRYSSDGKLVVSASSDHTARVWDASTGEPVIPPVDHGLPARVALLLDGSRRLFSAGEDGTGRFVDLAPTPLSTEDLRAYAHALSSRDIDSFEALRKLSKEQVVEALRSVRAHRPEFFAEPKP